MRELISPDLDWLQRRWGLPEHAFKHVRALLNAHSQGGTACDLSGVSPGFAADHWGTGVTVAASAAGSAATGPSPRPLVIVPGQGGPLLQSWHFFQAERQIAGRLLALAAATAHELSGETKLRELFPQAQTGDRQLEAARVALARQLTLITGGPGTGKTYTLARILALLIDSGIGPAQIRLTAPTGKAADRMKGAVSDSLGALPEKFLPLTGALKIVAQSSATLHSLIGYNPGTGCCRFDAANPLPIRVLIVDECSMIDVLLWRALLEALPKDARLILLGDPNQLESVGHGNVLSALAQTASKAASALSASHVHLTEARRFKDRPGILAFAKALETFDAAGAVNLLENSGCAAQETGLQWLPTAGAALSYTALPGSIRSVLEEVAGADTPQSALAALGKVCILTAQREYFVGSKATSAMIDGYFSRHPELVRTRPIIINQNDPETGLRNGAVGVIHTDGSGARKAWFPTLSGGLQEFSVARLPEYSPAWAITIHRSQGSEFDHVLVVLPQKESPMATRELLYTAITRAKHSVIIAGDIEAVRIAAGTCSQRQTLLALHMEMLG